VDLPLRPGEALADLVWKKLPEPPDPNQIFRGSVYFPYLPARQPVTAEVELTFPRRGRYVQEGFGVATRFPFSFLVKTRRMALRQEALVYPSVEPMDEFFEVLPMITGEFEAFVRGAAIIRIRDMPEDSAARGLEGHGQVGRLQVRGVHPGDERKRASSSTARRRRRRFPQPAERRRPGASWAGTSPPGTVSRRASCRPLRHLNSRPRLVQARTGPLPIVGRTDDYDVILTTRARGSIPTALWACSYFVFIEDRGERAG
jgi:hypothetical protein